MHLRLLTYVLLLAAPWASTGCGQNSGVSPFAASTSGIHVEIAYMQEAEPYTGRFAQGADYWSLGQANLDALFPAKTIRLPSRLEKMSVLPASDRSSFSSEDILSIAATVPDTRQHGEARFIVLWLDGTFVESGEPQPQVLGVSLGGTDVVALFKPVIAGSELGRRIGLAAFVEQSTFVHEIGHAIGLVNAGLPLTSDHHDEEHGAHCTNRNCVMYYLNEGLLDIREFAERFMETGETVFFGPECLADVAAAQG